MSSRVRGGASDSTIIWTIACLVCLILGGVFGVWVESGKGRISRERIVTQLEDANQRAADCLDAIETGRQCKPCSSDTIIQSGVKIEHFYVNGVDVPGGMQPEKGEK